MPRREGRNPTRRVLGRRRLWSLAAAGLLIVVGLWVRRRIRATILEIPAWNIEVEEALTRLRYLDVTSAVLLVLLCASVVATLVSAFFSAVSLRQRVREVGQYRLLGPIGRGGMGTVHLAEHALIRENRLKHIGSAFFTLNGVLSTVFFLFTSFSLIF